MSIDTDLSKYAVTSIDNADAGYRNAMYKWNAFITKHVNYVFPVQAPAILDTDSTRCQSTRNDMLH